MLQLGGTYVGVGEEIVSPLVQPFYRRIMGPDKRERHQGVHENTYTYDEWMNLLERAGFLKVSLSLRKDYRRRISLGRMLYYYFFGRLPDIVLKTFLVSSIHIEAKK